MMREIGNKLGRSGKEPWRGLSHHGWPPSQAQLVIKSTESKGDQEERRNPEVAVLSRMKLLPYGTMDSRLYLRLLVTLRLRLV